MGGEKDVRGFQIWGISPDRVHPQRSHGQRAEHRRHAAHAELISRRAIGATQRDHEDPQLPAHHPGGDTHVVCNFEYRIPIIGPVTLAIFGDAGVDRILRPSELTMDPARVTLFERAIPDGRLSPARRWCIPARRSRACPPVSRLQVMLPVVQAPFRVYLAYNPLLVREYLQPPIVADRSIFPNAGDVQQCHRLLRPSLSVLRAARYVPLHHRQDLLTAHTAVRAIC